MSSASADGAAVLDDAAAIERLTPEWAALWGRSTASPFQHPAWLAPWWAAFGTGRLRLATWRRGGQLEGVLPAYIYADPAGPKLLPVGAGTTDCLDVLGQGAAPLLAALLARCEQDGVGRFDMIDVPEGSALTGAPCPPGWGVTWSTAEACPVLDLAAIPPGIRRKQRMSGHRAERAGGWQVQEPGAAGLDTLVALHQSRWTAASEPGVLADPAVLRCLRIALPALQQAGLLRLQHLHVAGQPAAAILALLAPGRIDFYLSGYDAAQAFVSPGTILLGAMLDEAIAEGRTHAHFLRGREAYKYAWGATDRHNRTAAYRPTASQPRP